MRIISGLARRTPLVAPKGSSTRPTADRVKENLFNILAPHVAGARFLDLFCGSGAIGLEALSRGAEEAVFVDSAKDAIAALKVNLERTRLTTSAHAVHMCALAAVPMLGAEGKAFDIVFLDPPYGLGLVDKALEVLVSSGIVSPGGIVVAECDTKEDIQAAKPLVLQDTRAYGSTRILFYS